MLVHPEIAPKGDDCDRRLTLCGDPGCLCADMAARAAREGFVFVWNPERYPAGGYDKVSVP